MKKLIIKLAIWVCEKFKQYDTCNIALEKLKEVLYHWNDEK